MNAKATRHALSSRKNESLMNGRRCPGPRRQAKTTMVGTAELRDRV